MSSDKNIFSYLKKKRLPASKAVLDDTIIPKPVNFCSLFTFSRRFERFALFVGSIFAVIAGISLPVINLIYGELTNVMIDRQFPTEKPSQKVIVLEWFGGGRVLVNASREERMKALDEDALAFVESVATFSCLSLVFLALSVFIFNLMASIQVKRIRVKLFRTLLSQSSAWFDLKSHGNFTHKLTEDLNNVQNGIGERLAIFIYQISTTVIILGMCFYIGWLLTLVLLGCMVPMFVIFLVLNQIQSGITTNEVTSAEITSDVAEEVLSGIRTVVAYGGEDTEIRRYAEKLLTTQSLGIKKGLVAAFGVCFVWTIIYACYAVGFSFGYRLIIWDDEYNPTVLISVFFGVLTAATIISYSGPYWESFANARGSAGAVFRIIGTKSDINPFSNDGISGGDTKGEIEFKNVHFHYPSRPEENLLKGLSFKINPGEKVAIIGASGSGKSTILQLIQRLYDPVVGDILLDGVNLKSLNVSWLRRQMGVVLQEPILFTGTVSDNIAYGWADASNLEIKEAAKIAQAHEFIINLPDQYNTMLMGTTGTLSGGEKQRIAIARAIVRKPKILLLDEITSALDSQNALLVQRAINKAGAGLTSIIVTYDVLSLGNVDRIIVLEGGAVAEEGSHAALIKRDGVYNRLLKAQADNKERSITTRKLDRMRDVAKSQVEDSVHVLPGTRGTFLSDFSTSSRVDEPLHDNRFLLVNCCQFLHWNKHHWPFLYFGILSSIILGSTLPILVILFGELVGVLADVEKEMMYHVDTLSVIVAVIGFASGIFCFIQTYFLGVASARLGTYLRLRTFETMLRQEMAWFDSKKNRVSNLCALLNTDCSALQCAIGSRVGVVIQGSTAMLLGIFISMYYSWKMAMMTILGIPLIFSGIFFDTITSSRQRKLDEEAEENERKITAEALNNIKVVNSLGCESILLSQYADIIRKRHTNTHAMRFLLRGFAYSLSQTTVFFGYAGSLWFGAFLMKAENLHYKDVIKVSELIIYGCWVLGQALATAPNFVSAKEAAGRLQYLYFRKPRIHGGTYVTSPFAGDNKSIQFSSVYFSYPARPDHLILRNINLSIRDGESVALVGESGSGKSTVIQLLLRFYDPNMGSVSVGRMKLHAYKLSSLRRSMGLVSQEPVLFDRTIYENIAYGDTTKEVTMDEVIVAAKAADIHNFISSLPAGYQTRIGRSSSHLSGGQKQKIAIARALESLQLPQMAIRFINIARQKVTCDADFCNMFTDNILLQGIPQTDLLLYFSVAEKVATTLKLILVLAKDKKKAIRNPRILLLDEATSALDPESERSIQATLDRAMPGRTTITVAHKWEAIVNADTIYVLADGRITESGSHSDLMKEKGFYYKMRSEYN